MRKRIIITILVVALAGVLGAMYLAARSNDGRTTDSTPSPAATSPSNTPGITTIAKNLKAPWSIAFYGDTAWISLRDSGQILEYNRDNGSTRVVGTVAGAVRRGEGGLQGLAVDKQKRLYAYYTTATDNRISRFTLSGQPGNLSLGLAETIIQGLPSSQIHNGGRIAFGPDDLLYVTVGDAGVTSNSQNRASLGGKILRLTPDGGVPADNPFPNSPVYSYGHRNPQGLAWGEDGTMYATEFGQNTWDELNVIKPGANYGWPNVEGIAGRNGYVDPVQQWAPSTASPSGMAYANGNLYIANLRGAVLRNVPVNNLGTSQDRFKGEYGRLRDVAVAPDGRLWLLTNNTDGRGRPAADDDRIISLPN